jgi:hypothetical protein
MTETEFDLSSGLAVRSKPTICETVRLIVSMKRDGDTSNLLNFSPARVVRESLLRGPVATRDGLK